MTHPRISKVKKQLETMGRFSLGNESRANKNWEHEESRKCRSCGKEEETIRNIVEECEITGNSIERWRQLLNGDMEHIAKLHGIEKKSKRKEEEREE